MKIYYTILERRTPFGHQYNPDTADIGYRFRNFAKKPRVGDVLNLSDWVIEVVKISENSKPGYSLLWGTR